MFCLLSQLFIYNIQRFIWILLYKVFVDICNLISENQEIAYFIYQEFGSVSQPSPDLGARDSFPTPAVIAFESSNARNLSSTCFEQLYHRVDHSAITLSGEKENTQRDRYPLVCQATWPLSTVHEIGFPIISVLALKHGSSSRPVMGASG